MLDIRVCIGYNKQAFSECTEGYSSVGRAAVSKTACREFETYYPCHKRTGSSEPVRFVFAMFLRFRVGSASLCQYQWKNYFDLHFRKICGFSGSAFSRKGSFREAAFLFAAPATAGAAELLPSTAARRLPLRESWHGASRDRGSFLTFFQISEIYA